MNHFLHGVARSITETFALPEPIMEIGAYQVEGQEDYANFRLLFPGRDYIGVDMRPGPGVDCVANVQTLPQMDRTIGTVISFNTFEHVRHFWQGAREIHRVLRPDGAFLIACPFHFHIHNYPHDYWRFTPHGLETILEPFPSKIIGWNGARRRPAGVWGVGFREARPPITPEQFHRFRSLMDRYARFPADSWLKSLRYRLASLIGGRGYFAPYLERQRWDAVCLNAQENLQAAA